ncbi:SET domain-containing protein [Noviherbaspirillum pedocola]|uniref:SET domain-containing protein n=1 Tax=Noviherbaspirillum pedocola TaxID=2801341 RepID=A0A934W1S5_9BURK|nr:SET domain-containing methyltransferase [Noviherbaspirillum pedocola]MBK4735521.1 SET domain-containing protein [Noviherbaspirillum pedocola]
MAKWKVEKWGNAGEKQLVAAAPIAVGETILCEKPLVTVPADQHELGTYAWDLTHKLLANASLRNTYYSWQLKSEDVFPPLHNDTEIERLLAKRYGVQRTLVRKLYVGVVTNNIVFGAGEKAITGYGMYKTLSRANHSCDPSAAMVAVDPVAGEQGLAAKLPIQPGQEITWSYCGEDNGFLQQDYLIRNLSLVRDMGFVCRCSRCKKELPSDLKGVDRLRFFMDFLAQHEDSITKRATGTLAGAGDLVQGK